MKNYLIREFSEFDSQKFGQGMPNTHADNKNLSHGAFDKHIDDIMMSNVRLNDILNTIRSTNNIYDLKGDKSMDGLDITNLKVLRMFPLNEIDIDIYLSFDLGETNYYGVIKSFVINPDIQSEVFKDTNLFVNKEWGIKMRGLLLKTIKRWLNIPPNTKWKTLKPIQCINIITGELSIIDEDIEVKVVQTLSNNTIIVNVNDINCEIKGMNFYYFNYWFEQI